MNDDELENNLNDNNIIYLSKTKGNNKCIECGKKGPKWVSFPLGLFSCFNCVNFNFDAKSIEIDEFSQHEINLIKLGGNNRFIKLMKEYKIPIESDNKFNTNIVHFYINLIQIEVELIENENKNENNIKNKYQNYIKKKPSLEEGIKEFNKNKENEEKKENEKKEKNENEKNENENEKEIKKEENRELKEDLKSSFNTISNVFSFFGNSIKNVSQKSVNLIGVDKTLEKIGVNSMLKKTGDAINYFGKETGKIIENTSNKVADIGVVKNIIDKTNSGYSFVKRGSQTIFNGIDSTADKVIKYIKNEDENENNNENNNKNNENKENNENNNDIDDIDENNETNDIVDDKNNDDDNNNKEKEEKEMEKKNNNNIDNDLLEKREFGLDDY